MDNPSLCGVVVVLASSSAPCSAKASLVQDLHPAACRWHTSARRWRNSAKQRTMQESEGSYRLLDLMQNAPTYNSSSAIQPPYKLLTTSNRRRFCMAHWSSMNLSPQKHPRAEDLEIHTPERMNVIPAKSQPCFAQDLLIKLFRPTFHVLTLVRLEKRPRPFESIKSRLVPGKSAFPISDRSMMGQIHFWMMSFTPPNCSPKKLNNGFGLYVLCTFSKHVSKTIKPWADYHLSMRTTSK